MYGKIVIYLNVFIYLLLFCKFTRKVIPIITSTEPTVIKGTPNRYANASNQPPAALKNIKNMIRPGISNIPPNTIRLIHILFDALMLFLTLKTTPPINIT